MQNVQIKVKEGKFCEDFATRSMRKFDLPAISKLRFLRSGHATKSLFGWSTRTNERRCIHPRRTSRYRVFLLFVGLDVLRKCKILLLNFAIFREKSRREIEVTVKVGCQDYTDKFTKQLAHLQYDNEWMNESYPASVYITVFRQITTSSFVKL